MKNKKTDIIKIKSALIFLFMISLPFILSSESRAQHSKAHSGHMAASTQKQNSIKAEVFLQSPLLKDKKIPTEIEFISKKDNKPFLLSEIKEVHTEKIHLLIFDQTLTDYQHTHPMPTNKPGVYAFEWTPKNESQYKVWADLSPLESGQEYIIADLGDLSKSPQTVDKTLSSTYTSGEVENELHFVLSFDPQNLISKKHIMGKVVVTDAQGHPFSQPLPISILWEKNRQKAHKEEALNLTSILNSIKQVFGKFGFKSRLMKKISSFPLVSM
jgi:hypothetical protein